MFSWHWLIWIGSFNILAIILVPEQKHDRGRPRPSVWWIHEYNQLYQSSGPWLGDGYLNIYHLHTNTRYLLSNKTRYLLSLDIHLLGSLALSHGVLEVHEPCPVEQQRGDAQHEVEGQVGPGDMMTWYETIVVTWHTTHLLLCLELYIRTRCVARNERPSRMSTYLQTKYFTYRKYFWATAIVLRISRGRAII